MQYVKYALIILFIKTIAFSGYYDFETVEFFKGKKIRHVTTDQNRKVWCNTRGLIYYEKNNEWNTAVDSVWGKFFEVTNGSTIYSSWNDTLFCIKEGSVDKFPLAPFGEFEQPSSESEYINKIYFGDNGISWLFLFSLNDNGGVCQLLKLELNVLTCVSLPPDTALWRRWFSFSVEKENTILLFQEREFNKWEIVKFNESDTSYFIIDSLYGRSHISRVIKDKRDNKWVFIRDDRSPPDISTYWIAGFGKKGWFLVHEWNTELPIPNYNSHIIPIANDNLCIIFSNIYNKQENITISIYNPYTDSVISHDTIDSVLPSNRITSATPDTAGGVWIGTDSGLVHAVPKSAIPVQQKIKPGFTPHKQPDNTGFLFFDGSVGNTFTNMPPGNSMAFDIFTLNGKRVVFSAQEIGAGTRDGISALEKIGKGMYIRSQRHTVHVSP
jgi:hypothetical protein